MLKSYDMTEEERINYIKIKARNKVHNKLNNKFLEVMKYGR